LILGCRSKERGEAAVTKLEAETGYKSAELWVVDLAQISSVVDFTNRFEKEGGRLDILLENAGIIHNSKQQLTTDGYEPVFQVNNLCTSLLALRLLPIMLRTANKHHTIPRLVVVSSEVHYWVELEKYVVESPDGLEKFGKLEYSQIKQNRYMESKLLNVFFARGLNERVGDKPLIVNTVNPGYCYSSIRSGFTGLRAWADWLMEKAIARTSEEGSRQLIWACLGGNDNVDELRGAYVSALHVQEPSDYVVGEEGKRVQDKLWDALIDELAKSDPSVWEIVEKYLTSP
ncbi:retinol dehydrogenase 12, partial [Phlegmacium glaucopus]